MSKFIKASKLAIMYICCSFTSAFAANVTINTGFEQAEYPTDYSYTGARTDISINPAGSNWYIGFGHRDRTHESGQGYSRTDAKLGYRFRYKGGWIQPALEVRQDKANYSDKELGTASSQLKTNFYKFAVDYSHILTDNISLWGATQLGLERVEEKLGKPDSSTGDATRSTDYFTYEIEPGIRYTFSPDVNASVSYYLNSKYSGKGTIWGRTDNSIQNQQVRFYLSLKTPIGVTLMPYVRYSISDTKTYSWYNPNYDTEGTLNRMAIRAMYSINKNVSLAAEWYREDSEKNQADGQVLEQEMDYYRASVIFKF